MKYFFTIYLFIIGFQFHVNAQVVLGKITDSSTGYPLSNVTVVLTPGNVGTHSHEDGEFLLTPGIGNYTLEIRHVGYYPENKKIILKGEDTVNVEIMLKTRVFEQEQVVVTANKVEREKTAVPMNVTVISPEIIRESHESNIFPILSGEVPGLFITERGVSGFGLAGGSAGKISIRGVGGSDASFPVLLLIDGQPQFMGLMGHPIPDSYVSSDIEKVEVVKGPASLLYGTNAMGGAINLITRKQNKEGFSFDGFLSGGSFNTEKVQASAGYNLKGSGILASYMRDQTQGHRPSSGFRLDNVSFRYNQQLSRAFSLDASISRSKFKANDPGSIYGSLADYVNNSHWVKIERTNCYFSLTNRTRISEGGIKAYILWGDHNLYDGWKSMDENRGISLFQSLKLFRGTLVNFGFDIKKYGGKGTAASLGDKSGKYLSVDEQGVYLMVDHTLSDRLSINGGLRWDNHSGFGSTWIPQLGATYKTRDDSHFKLMISKGFRNPSIRELYFFPTANPDLKPERMWNQELTWARRIFNNLVSAEITVYMINGKNLILLVPHQPAPPPMKNLNSGSFHHKGLELSLKYSPSPGLTLNGSYSYLHMDQPKVAAPVHQLLAGGIYRYNELSVALNVRRYGKLYTRVIPDHANYEDFTVVNSKIAYRFNNQLEIYISGENLLNHKYQMQYGYPMPGMTFFGGVNFSM